ncbi:right-handed parallel beta-helix repeat-containing protein [Methylocystis sp. S23]
MRQILMTAGVAAGLCFGVAQANAQATRTFVSGVGDDVNPCSRTAPCKTFAGAISKTIAGGEIDVLDPGGFGAVTITKSITIDGEGTFASILASGTNGVVINISTTSPAPTVILRNLSINGAGTGLNGVNVAGGAVNLQVENAKIFGFTQTGIRFAPSNASFTSKLFVKDTMINEAVAGGVTVSPTGGPNAFGELKNVAVTRSGHGLRVQDRGLVTVTDSVFSENTGAGATVVTSGAGIFTELNIKNSVISANLTGVSTSGASSIMALTNTSVFLNGTGVSPVGGTINTFGNNQVFANTTNGAFNGSQAQQ